MIVLDTHVLIWVVDGDSRLGRTARAAIDEAGRADGIAVSAITPWEVTLLAEKGRLRLGSDAAVWINTVLDLPGVHLVPIEAAIAIDSVRLRSRGARSKPRTMPAGRGSTDVKVSTTFRAEIHAKGRAP